jgi:site-specific DNA-cytosine methylase
MNVVSLFNGMGTLRQALHNLGVKVDSYYSSEIKPYAIKLQQHHFPDVIQVGDIRNWREWDIDWSNIDFIGSGSPCQNLSSIGKREGINADNSGLFWIFIEILEHCKKLNSNVLFLQENVGSARKKDIGIMSRALGVYPVRINSSLVTAQLRDRYYWSNIRTKQSLFDIVTDIPQPIDRKIMYKDIITSGTVNREKSKCLLESIYHSFCYKDEKSEEAQKYLIKKEKFGTILIYENDYIRTVNKIEMCRLQGFPDNYCDILTTAKAGSLLGDGWTLPIIEHILSFAKF